MASPSNPLENCSPFRRVQKLRRTITPDDAKTPPSLQLSMGGYSFSLGVHHVRLIMGLLPLQGPGEQPPAGSKCGAPGGGGGGWGRGAKKTNTDFRTGG